MTTKNNVEMQYRNINADKSWLKVFRNITVESAKTDAQCLEAKKPQNKNLNRYRDVNPYDSSRIVLKRGSCDYINANLVKIPKAEREYILTQGPLPDTVAHFWAMIWEQNTRVIVMLNNLIEKTCVKCHCYWPMQENEPLNLTAVNLKVEFESIDDYSHYCVRKFKVVDLNSDEWRQVTQFHYTTWPDFGVPNSPTSFLQFLYKIRETGALDKQAGPAVVHCSAGIGRSGTFCLVDSCLVLIEKFGANDVDVKEILMEMRQYRMGLIQTPEQLRFSYLAIIEGSKGPMSNLDLENGNNKSSNDVSIDSSTSDGADDEEEPPPLPPRSESLTSSSLPGDTNDDTLSLNSYHEKPLPTIPNSESMNDLIYDEDLINGNSGSPPSRVPPSRPLPSIPQNSNESDSSNSDVEDTDKEKPLSPGALRKRKLNERNEKLSAQIKEIKRKQREVEDWEKIKRSLYKPLAFGLCAALLVGGGALAYTYYNKLG